MLLNSLYIYFIKDIKPIKILYANVKNVHVK